MTTVSVEDMRKENGRLGNIIGALRKVERQCQEYERALLLIAHEKHADPERFGCPVCVADEALHIGAYLLVAPDSIRERLQHLPHPDDGQPR